MQNAGHSHLEFCPYRRGLPWHFMLTLTSLGKNSQRFARQGTPRSREAYPLEFSRPIPVRGFC
jgi:hypothetical protein